MQQITHNHPHRSNYSGLLSLTRPNKELFQRHRALSRHAVPIRLDDYVDGQINFDEHLMQHKESTFFMRVSGDSMRDLSIFDGDLLVVDRSVAATNGCVIIAMVDGEFTIKQLMYTAQGQVLRAAHPSYPDMLIKPEQNLDIWGVVQWNVHKV